jgi:hypothetical protein
MNLLSITLADYIAQFSDPRKKLSGSMVTNQIVHFVNCIRDNIDDAVYRPMTFVFDGKQAMYTMDLAQVATGAGGTPPAYPEGILLNEDNVTPIYDENGAYIYV